MTVVSGRVLIGTEADPIVVLRDPRPDIEGWGYFVVELHGAGLDVVNGVRVHKMSPLPNFLRGLEADWRGWQGERTWRSTEPGLDIVARHDGGHIWMLWTAVDGPMKHWTASVEVMIDPGEQLSALVRDVADLLADL